MSRWSHGLDLGRSFVREPRSCALVLAALALAACFVQPGWTWRRALFEHVIVLDVTQSMNVQDQWLDGRPVSRLTYAKHVLQQTLPDLPCGSRVGWALFTEYRSYLLFTPIEVCANRAELRSSLAAIDGRMAWSGNSEIAKGLHSAVTISKALGGAGGAPSIVFVTDGQEAPPLDPRHRPKFDDKIGDVAGLVVGVGELKASPIPKTGPLGQPIGFWSADEVAQVDPRNQGRGGSVEAEKMIDDAGSSTSGGLGAMPGREHLSSLREAHLRVLAAENGFAFHRLRAVPEFAAALQAPALARPVEVRADGRLALAALAFVLLLAPYARAGWHQFSSLRRGMSAPRREHVMAAARAAKVSAADH